MQLKFGEKFMLRLKGTKKKGFLGFLNNSVMIIFRTNFE